jgi:hypothetical protein
MEGHTVRPGNLLASLGNLSCISPALFLTKASDTLWNTFMKKVGDGMCPYYCVILLQLWQPILSSYFLYYRHFGPNCWNRLILLPQKTYYGVRQGKPFILEDLYDETPVHVLLRKRSLWTWPSSESWSLSSPRCGDIIENLSQILRN